MCQEESEALGFLCVICQRFVPSELTDFSAFSQRNRNMAASKGSEENSSMYCPNCLPESSNISSRKSSDCQNNSLNYHQFDSCENDKKCFRGKLQQERSSLLSLEQFYSRVSGWNTFLLILVIGTAFFPASIMSSPLPKQGSASVGASFEHLRHHKEHSNRLHERPAKFINPCRLPSTPPALTADTDIQTQPDVDIFHNIITQSTKALRQAKEFVDDFYKESFGTELKNESKLFKGVSYDFLANATQKMNQYNNEQLSTLDVNEQIRFLYQALQQYAVGLEAIVLDQACYGGGFYQHFNEAEYQLKYVLCELQIAMLEKNIEYTDITRDIMSQKHRDIEDKTVRDIRDFVIFRDYIKALEYTTHKFRFFHDRAATAIQ